MSRKLADYNELQAEDISLRRLVIDDAPRIFEIRSDERVNRYIDREPTQSVEEATTFIHKVSQGIQQKDWYYWGICPAGEDEIVGTICLLRFNESKTCCEIGYELLPRFQGQGIVSKSVKAVLHFGFDTLRLPEISAVTKIGNTASQNLLLRAGFAVNQQTVDSVTYLLHNPYL